MERLFGEGRCVFGQCHSHRRAARRLCWVERRGVLRGELTAAVAGEVRRSHRATGDQDHPADHRPVRHDEGRPEGTGTFKPALSSLSRSLTPAPLSLQSETCSVEIPELEFELGMGALGGKFTTLEGLLKDVRDLVSGPGA